MEVQKESLLIGYPNVISYECTKKIIEQMEKCVCKIKNGDIQGTGFFCEIPFQNKDKKLSVIVTNNHIINRETLYKNNAKVTIDIKTNSDLKELNLNNRMKYTNEEYDITIIEIKEKHEIKNYLELDDIVLNDILYEDNKNKEFIDKTVYIIQYPESELSVSYGILENIYEDHKYDFKHKCSTKKGSSGAPILNMNNKIIGIHKECFKEAYNNGSFLNNAIKEFIQSYNSNKNNESDNDNNNEKLLDEFNKKYNLNIKDTKIKELDLSAKNIGNSGLSDLVKIEFKELTKLDLNDNNITNIQFLENAKFEKLEILDLGNNQITDINILEKVNFKELKELILDNNKITDINILEKVNFKELKILKLFKNNISDLNVLDKLKFKKLKLFI